MGLVVHQSIFVVLIFIVISCYASSQDIHEEGVQISVSSPRPLSSVHLPVSVSIVVNVTEGSEADKVRAEPNEFLICYGVDGNWPVTCNPILSADNLKLPPLHKHAFRCSSSDCLGLHSFQAYLQHTRQPTTRLGFLNYTFRVASGLILQLQQRREQQWQRDVDNLSVRPHFIEIGTSYFDTLAQTYYDNERWTGVSVEPVHEFLEALPRREGFEKINAMVCGESRSGGGGKDYVKGVHANKRWLYGLDHDRLKAVGLEDFWSGMASADPSHLWRSPELRSRIKLDTFRGLITKRAVTCVQYQDILDMSGSRVVVARLKVDAEGADIGIVEAALDAAETTCRWPWRIDFEAAHSLDKTSRTQTNAHDNGEAMLESEEVTPRVPSAFVLDGFDVLNGDKVKVSSSLNGLYHQIESIDSMPAFRKCDDEHFEDMCVWLRFRYELGFWILATNKSTSGKNKSAVDDSILAHTTTQDPNILQYHEPWDCDGILWVQTNYNTPRKIAASGLSYHSASDGDCKLFPGSGGPVGLILRMEDEGYICNCEGADCSCFLSPSRLARSHPECHI